MKQVDRFCKCIKSVKKTIRLRPGLGKNREGAAIAVCVKSVLQTKVKTLKKFRCRDTKTRKHFLITQ